MAGNSLGRILRLTTFGESHGAAIGGILDGCPAGLKLDREMLQRDLDRRKPGQSHLTTQRKEEDLVELLSGLYEDVTTGAPIGFMIRNKDQRSTDYSHLEDAFRPGHADFTYEQKYGIRDHRGGGRSSARETACRVAAGAIARQLLSHWGISVNAFVHQVGKICLEVPFEDLDLGTTYSNAVRCPHSPTAQLMENEISEVAAAGDTIGGVIRCVITGQQAGLGEPVFDKLPAMLAHAMLGINAVKGFEIGSGFSAVEMRGSQHNDRFETDKNGKIITTTNHSGGVLGGISNGMPILMSVAFKPVSTIMQPQQSVNKKSEKVSIEGKGRHDACVLPRAVPVVEAMAALVMADAVLMNRCTRL